MKVQDMAKYEDVASEDDATMKKAKKQWELTATEKIQLAESYKTKGTSLFKSNEIAAALSSYSRARYTLDEDPNYTGEEMKTKDSLFLNINLNCALCQLKLEQWNNALDSCDFAMQIETNNEKALYRKAQAYMGRKDHANAVAAFQAVLDIYPSNKAAVKALALAKLNLKRDNAQIKETYSGMFDKFAGHDSQKKALEKARGYVNNEPIGYWSNDMAAGMMSLQQEMEAFGERMPERSRRSSGGSTGSSPRT